MVPRRCGASFPTLSPNLAPQLRSFGGGGGGGARLGGGLGSAAAQPRGARPLAPSQPRPPAGDLGSGGRCEEGEARRATTVPGWRAAPRLPPYLPSAAGAVHHLPRALSQTLGAANLQNRAAQVSPRRRVWEPRVASLPNFPLPGSCFFQELCACPSRFLFIAQILCLQSPACFSSPDLASTGTGGREGGGFRGTEFGGGSRWPLHSSRWNMEAVGTGEMPQSHLAN